MQKTEVYTKDEQGDDLELAVLPPSGKVREDARIYSLAAYGRAVEKGVLIRQQVEKHLRDRNFWDDDRQREFERLRKSLNDGELAIERGGIRKSKARDVALQMIRDRAAVADLLSLRGEVEANTADALAEQAFFNYLVAACTVYNSGRNEGRPYFSRNGFDPSVEDYVERGSTGAAFAAASAVSEVVNGKRRDAAADLPEYKFLKKYGFVDGDLNLVDEKGRLVDEKGRLVDAEGYFVDESGGRVDSEGNPVGEDGRYKVEFAPFLDDDDNPIAED